MRTCNNNTFTAFRICPFAVNEALEFNQTWIFEPKLGPSEWFVVAQESALLTADTLELAILIWICRAGFKGNMVDLGRRQRLAASRNEDGKHIRTRYG